METQRVEQGSVALERSSSEHRMIVTRSTSIQRISYRLLARFANRNDQVKQCTPVRLNSLKTMSLPPSSVGQLGADGPTLPDGNIERGERRDSEMLEADDWADTFVDSTPKFDPSTYNKRELAHRLAHPFVLLFIASLADGKIMTGVHYSSFHSEYCGYWHSAGVAK